MTEALGYRRNRHEGKLTGLLRSETSVYDQIKSYYKVREDGLIETRFKSKREMKQRITQIGQSTSPRTPPRLCRSSRGHYYRLYTDLP